MTDSHKDPSKIAAALLEAANQAGPQVGLLGSRAGMVARSADPNFRPQDYGAASLRDFIARHVKPLKVIGLSGTDPVYGFSSWRMSSDTIPVAHDVDPWRIWVSPMSPFALAIRRDSGAVRALPREESVPDEEAKVTPLSIEKHKLIARTFLEKAEVPQQLRDTLNAALEANSVWWQEWTRILRMQSDELTKTWFDHRREGLVLELERVLRESNISGQAFTSAIAAIAPSQAANKPTQPMPLGQPMTRPPAPNQSPRHVPLEPSQAPSTLVSLVQQVVAHMGEHELRALPLPIGLVLDALGATRFKR